jgi:hypothetical protein
MGNYMHSLISPFCHNVRWPCELIVAIRGITMTLPVMFPFLSNKIVCVCCLGVISIVDKRPQFLLFYLCF